VAVFWSNVDSGVRDGAENSIWSGITGKNQKIAAGCGIKKSRLDPLDYLHIFGMSQVLTIFWD